MSKTEALRTMGATFSSENFRNAYLNLYRGEKGKGKTFQEIFFQNLSINPKSVIQDIEKILDECTDLPFETFADVFFKKFENASPWTGHNSMLEIPEVCAAVPPTHAAERFQNLPNLADFVNFTIF